MGCLGTDGHGHAYPILFTVSRFLFGRKADKVCILICFPRYARGMISGSGSTLFEELGLYYIGPVDGHNLDDLVAVLNGGWAHRPSYAGLVRC